MVNYFREIYFVLVGADIRVKATIDKYGDDWEEMFKKEM